MRRPRDWVEGLSQNKVGWAVEYLDSQMIGETNLSVNWRNHVRPALLSRPPNEQSKDIFANFLKELCNTKQGSDLCDRLADTIRKRQQRQGKKRIERSVVFDRESDQALNRIMKDGNIDRSAAVRNSVIRCAGQLTFDEGQVKLHRADLRRREKALAARAANIYAREQAIHEPLRKLTEQNQAVQLELDEALAELTVKQGEAQPDENRILASTLSQAPANALVLLQFDEEGLILSVEVEGDDEEQYQAFNLKLKKALKPFLSDGEKASGESG